MGLEVLATRAARATGDEWGLPIRPYQVDRQVLLVALAVGRHRIRHAALRRNKQETGNCQPCDAPTLRSCPPRETLRWAGQPLDQKRYVPFDCSCARANVCIYA